MGDATITVSGAVKRATSCSITYAVNRVPVAALALDATDNGGLICNPDTHRREKVSIKLSTKDGCLKFDGMLDGVSVAQSPGFVSYDAIIKGNFQKLAELYPRFPGLNPASTSVWTRENAVKAEGESGTVVNHLEFLDKEGNVVNTIALDGGVVKFLKSLFSAWVRNQVKSWPVFGKTINEPIGKVQRVLEESVAYQQKVKDCITLIDSLNISAVDNKNLAIAGDSLVMNMLYDYVFSAGNNTNMWDALIGAFNDLGLCVIVGNEQMFLAPYHGFIQKTPTPGDINVAFPNQYSSFSLSDSGYIDMDFCCPFFAGDGANGVFDFSTDTIVSMENIDPKLAKGAGVLVTPMPKWLSISLLETAANAEAKSIKDNVTAGSPLYSETTTQDEMDAYVNGTGAMASANAKTTSSGLNDVQNDLIHSWATVKLLSSKYSDRTGSIITEFNPKWCPGTSGVLRLKYPVINMNFFVERVTHNISVSPSNTGTATTTIDFSFGRLGDTLHLDTDEIFTYDVGKMTAVQQAFTSDIGV